MRILIADDEPLSQLILQKQLERWGYEIELVNNGAEASERLQQEDAPSIAILDWEMPGMTGPEICHELRSRSAQPYIYLLLLTSKSENEDIIAGLEAGADDYLTKPFVAGQLRARLRAGRRIVDLQTSLLSAREALQFPATHDVATGLWNREAILALLRRELQRTKTNNAPVSLLLGEVDGFAVLRARASGEADQVLQHVARRIKSIVRAYDSVGRYSESQFLIISPTCPPTAASALAERLRAAIAAEPVDVLTGAIDTSMSLGIASVTEPAEAESVLSLLEAALDGARRSGRNCAQVAGERRLVDKFRLPFAIT